MAVVKAGNWEKDKPGWCKFSAYGLYRVEKGKKEEDYHFHDCDEYFIVTGGKAPLLLEDVEYEIVPGDCVCIPQDGMHQILTVKEDLMLIWIYDELRGIERKGHIIPEGEKKKIAKPVKIVKEGKWLNEKPEWSRLTDYGILNYPGGKIEMDYHYHDCHEYYFVTKGRVIVLIDGKETEAGEGDVVCIEIGRDHVPVEAMGETQFIWLQDELMREKRRGHLHR